MCHYSRWGRTLHALPFVALFIFTIPFFLSSHFYLPPSPLWCSLPFSPSRFRRTSEEKFSVQRWRSRSARLSVVWLSAYVFSGNDTLAPHYRQNAVTSLPSYGPFHWPRWLKRRPGPICSHPQSQKTSLVFSHTDEGDRYNPCSSCNVLLYGTEQAGDLFHHTNTDWTGIHDLGGMKHQL